jgi:phage host-nuclease inhibitor protein Gam
VLNIGWSFQEEEGRFISTKLEINKDFYVNQANLLLDKGITTRNIANGEATYFLTDRKVNYSARELGLDEIQSDSRNQFD